MSEKKTKLVWSDDPRDLEKLAQDAGRSKEPQATDEVVKAAKWVAVFRLEKSGRGGKTVTVIDQLPKQEHFLNDLCRELKTKCGTGGTYSMEHKEGLIEIQGDKRVQIKAIFEKKGFKYKGM